MLAHERKSAAHMGFVVEERGLETRRAVTRRTIRARRPRCELPLVRVLMTVLTEFVRDRAAEVAFFVALPAGHFRMLPGQTKLRRVVIEIPAGTIILPAAGVVTPVAFAAELHVLECAVVGIVVTTRTAVGERHAFKEDCLLKRIAVRVCPLGWRLTGS